MIEAICPVPRITAGEWTGRSSVQPAALDARAHTIEVTVQDATPLARSDPDQLLVDTRIWTHA